MAVKSGARGGDQLARKLAAVIKKVEGMPRVRVGFLENSKYEDGTSVAMVAAVQEFGAPRASIPARPFFRPMIAAHKADWGKTLGKLLQATNYDGEGSLQMLGEEIAGQLRQSIVDVNAPPLSAVTLMLRWMKWKKPGLVVTGKTVGEAAARVAAGKSSAGVSTKPLIETGIMLGSVGVEVKS